MTTPQQPLILPQTHFSRLCRAVIEFDMIQAGDRILVGFSGGKDSTFLLYALACLRQHSRKPFSLGAFTMDPMFSDDFDTEPLRAFCDSLDIPFATNRVDIAGIIAAQDGKDPCFSCSFFRRGAVNRHATENGYNKVAYAHHHDDAVETFFMGLLHSGQLKTFNPVTELSRSNLTVIRPLIYFREQELRDAVTIHGFTPIPSPCPLDGHTKRQEIKELLETMSQQSPALYSHLSAAMRQKDTTQLWPQELTRDQLKQKHIDFWRKE